MPAPPTAFAVWRTAIGCPAEDPSLAPSEILGDSEVARRLERLSRLLHFENPSRREHAHFLPKMAIPDQEPVAIDRREVIRIHDAVGGLIVRCRLRLTPTDVTQFVRQEQCERYLRFRIAERAGQKFMKAYDVIPQRVTPLLSLSGASFEDDVEAEVGKRFSSVNYDAQAAHDHNRPDNNQDVVAAARLLKPGQVLFLFQTRLEAELNRWLMRGDVDLIRLERDPQGTLRILIADMKASAAVKVEHRLQVAFYRLMLESLLAAAEVPHLPIDLGIVFRPPVDPSPEEEEEVRLLRDAAKDLLGLDDALLELVADPDAYVQSAQDLVFGETSVARRVAATPFDQLPYCLSFKCDGCLYDEFCMKWSAETDDLSLLPYLSGTEKDALRRAGIATVQALASLKEFAPPPASATYSSELVPAAGKEPLVKQLAASWPVGPRLDELIHRAKSYRRSIRRDGTTALSFIPGKGNSTLPACRPDLNPNLVTIYLDAQNDYLEGRVYLLGATVVAHRDGEAAGRRSIVRMTDGVPDTVEKERKLFIDWTRELLHAVVELAVSDAPADQPKSAPVHVVFFDRYEQRVMLDALARNFAPIMESAPPLYDFLTQLAAFDSPVATFLDEEVRDFRNFPMTCPSLQAIAGYLKFDWNAPQAFRTVFRSRMFDSMGKFETDTTSEWYTRRSRFSSSIPLEYAYAAWGQIPKPAKGKGDEFASFRDATTELLLAFEQRRLEAVEHVAGSLNRNPYLGKTSFVLPDLANYEDKAHDLAHALAEFVAIERFVTLSDWKTVRHAPAERRVLMGETLLVRYLEADQDPGIAAQNRDNEVRRRKREELKAAFEAAHPGKRLKLTDDQKSECDWSQDGVQYRLRIETTGVDCDLEEALLLSGLREGEMLVLTPRWATDERLPAADRKEFTPTPKQVLYGQRVTLVRIMASRRNREGRVAEAFVDIEMCPSRGNQATAPFVFGSFARPLEADKLYTLDPCPDEWYAYWCAQVVRGLCDGAPNVLYDILQRPSLDADSSTSRGQLEFLAGLDALRDAGMLHRFEPSKREFIGEHSRTPVLQVQGPPGTGTSYSTAFAELARLQGAMRAGEPCRVFLTCKTHAATDVLIANVLRAQRKLQQLKVQNPDLFGRYFDARLLDVLLYRIAPKDPPPDGIVGLGKDRDKDDGEAGNVETVEQHEWVVVGATPGGIYGMLKARWPKNIFGHEVCDLLVLDEASQMNLPEALMAALPLRRDGRLVVVGDHRQMPPIVKHDWDNEARRTFREFQVYESLFDTLRAKNPPMIRFEESFRLHASMAEFLRQEIYRHDGIAYFSRRKDLLPDHACDDPLAAAALRPDYPLIVIVHDETESQTRNEFEQAIVDPILRVLADKKKYALDAEEGIGVVVPHRAQRAAFQQAFPELCVLNAASGLPARSAVDTVERFQGGERTAILVSATESDRAYLLASSKFLLDPRRLTVALSRAKRKMILVASRSIFSLFSPDEETFANAIIWKNLLRQTCTELVWEGERAGKRVAVWGGR